MPDPTTLMLATVALAIATQEPQRPDPGSVPTWHGSIGSLIETRCTGCHDGSGAGPFRLARPEDITRRSRFIRHVVETGIMPPWLPEDSGVPLRGDRSLSREEKDLLISWIESGAPLGTPPDGEEINEASSTTVEPGPSREPVVARMRLPWNVPAEGGIRWFKAERDKRTFVLPIENEAPLRVRSVTYHSASPVVLGATALACDDTGNARRMVDWDEEPGSYMMGDIGFVPAGSLGVVGPGGGSLHLPDGYHFTIPAGSDLVSEVHFRPQGRIRTLDDSVELETVPDDESSRGLVAVNLMVRKLELEAGQRRTLSSDLVLPMDVDLVALTPRASRRCTGLEVVLRDHRGDTRTLLRIDDWNPHYRQTFVLESAIRLSAGDRIEAIWRYDNSEENPRNPVIPPEEVELGARVGVANVLLMCAPAESSRGRELAEFAVAEMRRRQR